MEWYELMIFNLSFFRKKLLQSLNPNKRQLRMWDPELIAMKQRALVSQVYGKLLTPVILHMGLDARKPVFGGLRTTKAQTSLRIRAD